MTQPPLRFRPLRPAVAADSASTLELLLTITTPDLSSDQQSRPRAPVNLVLVIDRSGSMAGQKLRYARKVARFLAGELTAGDRLAIVSFDGEVNVVVPSTPVADPLPLIAAIDTIHSGGCTALFDGWLEGAMQVANQLDPTALNIATSGDGTLAFIETPGQLADLYASELKGLATTAGRKVSLGMRAKH